MQRLHLSPLAILVFALGCPSGGVKPGQDSLGDDTAPPDDSEPLDTDVTQFGIDLRDADTELVGEAEGDYAGLSCRMIDDVNGDGTHDVLVGAPGHNGDGNDVGRAYLVYGAHLRGREELMLDEADLLLLGEGSGDGAGGRVAAAGDIDGDAAPDLLVAAYENDDGAGNAGKVYLLRGAGLGRGSASLADADWSFVGEQGNYQLGVSVAGGGDVDGDGLDDMLLGALGSSMQGYVHVVLGSAVGSGSMPISMANHALAGEGEGDNAGISSDIVGDVDGDGLADLVVGAYGRDAAGQASGGAYIVLASELDAVGANDLGYASHRYTGQSAGDLAGFAVAGAGDVDGDGLADVLVGADCNNEAGELAGKAYLVLSGNLGETTAGSLALADAELIGESPGDRAGGSVAGAGDVDGDSRDDVLVGACYNSQGSSNEGKAYLVLGNQLALGGSLELATVERAWVGVNTGDLAGRTVAGGGDVNGDGVYDLLIGATHANESGDNDAGKVYVILGGGW